jgi:hypothetical protein
MKRTTKKGALAFGVMTGVTLLVGGAETADAAVLEETENFSLNSIFDSSPSNLTFDQFNPSLGTLTGVDFVLDSTPTTIVSVENNSEAIGATSSAEAIGTFEVEFTSGGDFAGPVDIFATVSCDSNFCTDSNDGLFFGTFPVNISGFTGLGTFDSLLRFFLSQAQVMSCEGGPCFADGSVQWNGSLTVRYTYDAVGGSVPVPGTLALLGVGLAGLGFLGWRRNERRTS